MFVYTIVCIYSKSYDVKTKLTNPTLAADCTRSRRQSLQDAKLEDPQVGTMDAHRGAQLSLGLSLE